MGEPNKEEMLWLETEVYCATEGTEEEDEDNVKLEEGSEKPKGLRVFACAGCRTREVRLAFPLLLEPTLLLTPLRVPPSQVKRAQRKLAARIRPTLSDSELDTPYPSQDSTGASGGTQDERHKIVLFNCGSVLDFSTGECTLPARVTCYCRHHREKVGFLSVVVVVYFRFFLLDPSVRFDRPRADFWNSPPPFLRRVDQLASPSSSRTTSETSSPQDRLLLS